MSAIAILSFLVGTVLGRGRTMLVLLPALLLGIPVALGVALATGASFTSALWDAALVALGLQLGYVAGVLVRYALTAARSSRLRSDVTAVARRS